MATIICPYCGIAQANSDDHVIPHFLGGNATVRACKTCNDRFGHDVEGPVSDDFKQIVVALAQYGLKPKKPQVWRRAFTDPDERRDYDLDTNGELDLSHPHAEYNSKGEIVGILTPNDDKLTELHAKSLAKDENVQTVQQRFSIVGFTKPQFKLHVPIGEEIRRLALKMCAGIARLDLGDGSYDVLGPIALTYLAGGEPASVSDRPVRVAVLSYEGLDKLRPPLSHVVYVEGDTVDRRCYGVVQFLGAIQLYVLLDRDYRGRDFARIGLVNPYLDMERFDITKQLNLYPAPESLYTDELASGKLGWLAKLAAEAQALTGKEALHFSPPSSLGLPV